MESYLQGLLDMIPYWRMNSPGQEEYLDMMSKNVRILLQERQSKSFNWKLLRKIFLVASLAGVLVSELSIVLSATSVAWISDRDGIVEKYNNLALDLMFSNLLELHVPSVAEESTPVVMLDLPKLFFLTSKKDTVDDYEELVRLPDFLAGVVSELNGKDYNFRHGKYSKLFFDGIVDAPNHSIVAIDDIIGDFYIRRMKYVW